MEVANVGDVPGTEKSVLSATGASGSATDEVKTSTTPDRLTATRVRYTHAKGDWRVTGTSSLHGRA